MTPRRLRLWGEPGQLARVGESAVDEARRRLHVLRDDVDLTAIDQRAADSIDIVLLVPASFRNDDIGEIATILREALGIGAGPHEQLIELAAADLGFDRPQAGFAGGIGCIQVQDIEDRRRLESDLGGQPGKAGAPVWSPSREHAVKQRNRSLGLQPQAHRVENQ